MSQIPAYIERVVERIAEGLQPEAVSVGGPLGIPHSAEEWSVFDIALKLRILYPELLMKADGNMELDLGGELIGDAIAYLRGALEAAIKKEKTPTERLRRLTTAQQEIESFRNEIRKLKFSGMTTKLDRT